MNNKMIILTTLVLFNFCHHAAKNDIETYYVEMGNNRSALMSDLIKEINIIPLETNDFSLIKEISKIEYYDNKLYVLDLSQNIIIIFSKDGKYINRIDNIGQGPNDYLHIADYAINKYTGLLCILDPIKNKLLYYNHKGNYQYNESLPQLYHCAFSNLQFIDDKQIMFWSFDENNRFKIFDRTTQSITMENLPRSGYPRTAQLFSDSLFIEEMSNIVFSFNNNKFHEYYKIEIDNLKPDLREQSLSKSYDSMSQHEFLKKLIRSENIDYLIKEMRHTPDHIIFSFYRKEIYYTFIINKNTRLFFNFNTIDKDFIPFIKNVDNNVLLGVYFPEYFSIYKSILGDDCVEILKNNPDVNNPILIKYSLK